MLLDADVRFFGAMMIGIGVILFWPIARVTELGSVIYLLAGAVAVGRRRRIIPASRMAILERQGRYLS